MARVTSSCNAFAIATFSSLLTYFLTIFRRKNSKNFLFNAPNFKIAPRIRVHPCSESPLATLVLPPLVNARYGYGLAVTLCFYEVSKIFYVRLYTTNKKYRSY